MCFELMLYVQVNHFSVMSVPSSVEPALKAEVNVYTLQTSGAHSQVEHSTSRATAFLKKLVHLFGCPMNMMVMYVVPCSTSIFLDCFCSHLIKSYLGAESPDR